ncbi:Peptide methionine sulfoxide reductase [Mycena chlorophos]|uniref:Peptide methionine sulfoxide reductase n=1 Tax=Mycena chlorophos TaxID=658473 RepID=A0A8H6VTN0_MYCCL|nr:Peptide methionine sulfoxide reductase [Mycena chlorophos]
MRTPDGSFDLVPGLASLAACPFFEIHIHHTHIHSLSSSFEYLEMAATLSATRPLVSSPLSGNGGPSPARQQSQTYTRSGPAFPTSRALRPFPSSFNSAPSLRTPVTKASGSGVKLIQPPASQKEWFVLDLTQAELSRQ